MLTSYQYASNTPIWAMDLDGLEADYFNINGDFRRRSNKGEPKIYITNENQTKVLSDYKHLNKYTLRKIGQHYAGQIDEIPDDINIWTKKGKSIMSTSTYWGNSKHYRVIYITKLSGLYQERDGRIVGGTSPLIDNYHNFKCCLNHEYRHWNQYKLEGVWKQTLDDPYTELDAIDYEISQDEWRETTSEWKKFTVTYAGQNIAKIKDTEKKEKWLNYFENRFKVKYTNLSTDYDKVHWKLNTETSENEENNNTN